MNKYEKIVQSYRCSHISNDGICAALHYLKFFPRSVSIKEDLALMYYYFVKSSTHIQKGLNLLTEVEHMPINEETMKRVVMNRYFYLQKLRDPTYHETPTVIDIDDDDRRPFPRIKIMFSITSCKRLDLFIRTVDAFLTNCNDKHLIDEWLCVDDNSSDEDRQVMMEKYSFFKFIFKSEEQRGHPISMKMIVDHAKESAVSHLIHVEDDRELLYPRTYITDMLRILESQDDIGQVAFNHNYAETVKDDDIKGGILKQLSDGSFYYEHEYCPTAEDKKLFVEKYGNCRNCNYYPHFTLSPSIIKTSIFDALEFKTEPSFEFCFASRYTEQGFKTVFLPGYHIEHIGRLTSELYDISKFNAYDLNCDLTQTIGQFNYKIKFKSFVINLDRRPDRMALIDAQKPLLPLFERVSAFDGRDLTISKRLRSLCRHGDYYMRPGVIGCVLSHLKLYMRLIDDKEHDGYLIFEDDVVVDECFLQKLNRVLATFETKHITPSILFLTTAFSSNPPRWGKGEIVKKSYAEMTFSIGGSGCYFISKRAAQAVIDEIQKNTIKYAIDAILQRLGDVIDVYFVLPPICTVSFADTDIQHDIYSRSPLLEDDLTDEDYSPYILYGKDGTIDLFEEL